jgi:hypothetical protein
MCLSWDFGTLRSCSRLSAREYHRYFTTTDVIYLPKNDDDHFIAKADLVDDLYWIREENLIASQEIQQSSIHGIIVGTCQFRH